MTSWQLSNGLTVYILPADIPFAAVVLGYRVGAAHEPIGQAGAAHLLEHLLFEDEDIAYDEKIQTVGGNTNAYTGQDYTVYYARVPREKLPLALRLEAQRLFDLKLSPEKIAIQRQVVAEEFRQRYLNPPYADRFFHLVKMAFPNHPYGTMVIGESPEQVLSLPDEVLHHFYQRFYVPANAVLCIAGGGIDEGIYSLVQALYDRSKLGERVPDIPSVEVEPISSQLMVRKAPVPQKAVIWAYRLPPLQEPITHAFDLLDDFMGHTQSGLLTQRLVHKQGVASRLNTFLWQMHQGGLWVIEAYLPANVSVERYEEELQKALLEVPEADMSKALEVYRPMRYLTLYKERAKVLGRATSLVHAVLAGHPEWYEAPLMPYERLSVEDLQSIAREFITAERLVRLHYLPEG
ncbi:MAG: insulinase family protein [Bacteroidia bacterium]|nr:insulinase family protein [Bacteroidia bacterium]MCX7651682.1 insulinase family protein [Bacteroidia bacterium]MDW8417684.1 pitrilysin family protein [Bacteroidia bacterium]